jgi:hypothetical protein
MVFPGRMGSVRALCFLGFCSVRERGLAGSQQPLLTLAANWGGHVNAGVVPLFRAVSALICWTLSQPNHGIHRLDCDSKMGRLCKRRPLYFCGQCFQILWHVFCLEFELKKTLS